MPRKEWYLRQFKQKDAMIQALQSHVHQLQQDCDHMHRVTQDWLKKYMNRGDELIVLKRDLSMYLDALAKEKTLCATLLSAQAIRVHPLHPSANGVALDCATDTSSVQTASKK